jgi:hypothetical protein
MKLVCEICGCVAEALVRDAGGRTEIACGACGAAQQLGGAPAVSEEEQPAEPSPVASASPGGDDAWSEVVAHWEDDAAHEAYLDRFTDLPSLGDAGQHYREVLDARPSDETARRWRDEIVKRASVIALSQIPRTRPPQPTPRWARAAIGAGIAGLVIAIVVIVLRLIQSLKGVQIP